MKKQIINSPQNKGSRYSEGIDLSLMTNDNKLSKRILTQMLKSYTLLIELNDKSLISASYKDYKIIGRTTPNILLVYDEIKSEEVEIDIDSIRIIRVCKR